MCFCPSELSSHSSRYYFVYLFVHTKNGAGDATDIRGRENDTVLTVSSNLVIVEKFIEKMLKVAHSMRRRILCFCSASINP